MAEEIVEQGTVEQEQGTTPAEAETTEQEPQQQQENTEETTIPYTRFKEVNDKYRELQKRMDDIEAAKKQAEIDSKKEEGKWKELYTGLEEQLAQERAANEQLKFDSLRRGIAREHGHEYLWDRLRGETEEELIADLQSLIASMPSPQAPSTNGAAGSGARTAESEDIYSEAELQELSARLHIPVEHLPKRKPTF